MKSRQSNRTPTHRILAVSLFTVSALAALFNHAFSDNGRTIAYSTSPKPGLWFAPFNIYLMNADGTNPTMLTEARRWAYEYTPCWSNDGSSIVYDRQEPDGTSDIYAINADGSGAANLTRTPRVSDHSASWRPSGLSVPRTARLVTSWCELKGAR